MSAEPVTPAETTMSLPVVPETIYPTIGDMLAATMPGYDILPCGRCGTAFSGYPASLLAEARVLWPLVQMARDAGWGADDYGIWACPSCLDAAEEAAEKAERAWAEAYCPGGYTDILAAFDRAARAVMERAGGEWEPSRWRYAEPMAERWAA
jgi:hypothetical protein